MIPQTISLAELQAGLPAYLERAAAGESFLIAVQGKVVVSVMAAVRGSGCKISGCRQSVYTR